MAVPKEYEGRPIEAVRFEPPLQPVARADLNRLVPLQPGAPLRQSDVRDAIKRLYNTGEYQDIEVTWETSPSGVVLVFRTVEQWFTGPVEVRGKVSLPPSAGQLANAARLELGTPFNDEDIEAAGKGIQDLMQRNGLYQGTVQPKVERDNEHQQVTLTFQVNSGKRARLTTPAITGDTKLRPEVVAKAARYKGRFRWKLATASDQQSGVQNVRKRYNKDERLTANVVLDHVDYNASTNTVKPAIRADGGPKVQVKASGAKISKGNLQKYVPVFDEETVNRDLLVRGVANLRDYFQNKGYFDVEVDFQDRKVTPDQEEVTYAIGLGERHKVVKLEVTGNHYFKADQIRERMFLQPAGTVRLRHGRFSQGFAKRDEAAITALYRDSGFRDCKVTAKSIDDYQGKTGNVAVTMEIEEGSQYTVGKIDVQGINRPDRAAILARLASLPGQPFSESNVGLDRDTILGVYQSAGYPDVSFDWRISNVAERHEADLVYVVNEGPPRYVRDVLISGLRATRMRLVQPNVLLKAGEPLSWTQMGVMQRRLYDLGVFDKVDMAIQNQQGDTENKYVLYHLTEGHRYYVGVGVGAEVARIGGAQDSLDQPAGATGFSPRGSFEVSRLNMWGLGHSLNFKSRYSTLDRRVSLNYLAPRYRNVEGRNISFTALYDNTRDVRTFTAQRYEGSVQLSQRLSKATTALWRYTWRDVVVDKSTLKINPLLIPSLAQPARIAIISANLIQDRRDDPVDAHRGIYNSGDLGLVEHYFGGNKNYLKFLGRNSYYKRVHGDIVLASNTQFGWMHPFSIAPGNDPAQYVPLPERFFGGGSGSQRGFPDNQAGPRDLLTGFPIGGNALLFHSTELRFPFLGEDITGVLFHDLGNVYTDLGSISFRYRQRDNSDFNYMVQAAGFGVRYRTPVGPLRVDLAYSLNPPVFNGLKGTYQQLLLNQATPAIQRVSHFQFFFSIGQAF
ncbi:MAG TPA: BamA/TamA family outer membrane protein [Candidatus Acidoferrales bacterium]|nr:BamA/TamA family outer membrane protein [Candidatus Acidoferrales bacterium]